MWSFAITIEDDKPGWLGFNILPMYGRDFGRRERVLQISAERVVGRRNAPFGQRTRRRWRQMPLPRSIEARGAYFEIGEVGSADEISERELPLLNTAFQVAHHQGRRFHVFDIELGLRSRNF